MNKSLWHLWTTASFEPPQKTSPSTTVVWQPDGGRHTKELPSCNTKVMDELTTSGGWFFKDQFGNFDDRIWNTEIVGMAHAHTSGTSLSIFFFFGGGRACLSWFAKRWLYIHVELINRALSFSWADSRGDTPFCFVGQNRDDSQFFFNLTQSEQP